MLLSFDLRGKSLYTISHVLCVSINVNILYLRRFCVLCTFCFSSLILLVIDYPITFIWNKYIWVDNNNIAKECWLDVV